MSRPSGRTTRNVLVGLLIVAAAASTADRPGVAGGPPDRLDQFRQLALSRPSMWQADADAPPDAYRQMYALLDEEIVESLGTGGLFASPAFLQDRLDAFSEVWGAAAVGVVRVGRLVVGAFQMSDAPGINSVRVYGRLGGEAALLATLSREGRPTVFPWAPAPNGVPQFVAVWEGPASGRGTRALRLDLARQQGDSVRVVWSSTDVFPDGLFARAYSVRGEEIRVRYELFYPGWIPGCEGQTEGEDVFQPARESGAMIRRPARQLNTWHRDLRATVAQLFDALGAGDQTALARLVADAQLRGRLPRALRPEPACDATDGSASPHTVSVAATAEHTPWTLTFERASARWRLTAARPVFE